MTTVGDVLELAYGKALKAEDRTGGTVPVVGSGGIVGLHSVAITEDRTIVVGRKGSIGSVTWVDGPGWPIDTAYYVKAKEPDLDLRWTYWMLNSLPLASMNKSAAVPGLNRNDVYRLPVVVPSAAEQRRIAAILDRADAIRAKRRRILSYLDSLTASMFRGRFGDPVANELGFPRATIGSLAVVQTGNSPSRAVAENFGDQIEWLKSDNLGAVVATHADEGLSETGMGRARIAPVGSILVTCIAGSPTSIGKSSIVDRAVAFNQQINAVLPSDAVDAMFLLAQLKTSPELVRAKSTGGMKGLVNKTAFSSIEVLAPPLRDQREFADRMRSVMNLRRAGQDSLVDGDELFASLQARAFRGEL